MNEIEKFNTISETVFVALWLQDREINHDGEPICVTTPWAVGAQEEKGG